jgi:hypothetical protein
MAGRAYFQPDGQQRRLLDTGNADDRDLVRNYADQEKAPCGTFQCEISGDAMFAKRRGRTVFLCHYPGEVPHNQVPQGELAGDLVGQSAEERALGQSGPHRTSRSNRVVGSQSARTARAMGPRRLHVVRYGWDIRGIGSRRPCDKLHAPEFESINDLTIDDVAEQARAGELVPLQQSVVTRTLSRRTSRSQPLGSG